MERHDRAAYQQVVSSLVEARAPNSAVPTRTRVVPASRARSRSPVMPIEQVGRASSSVSRRATVEGSTGADRVAVGRSDRHHTVEVEVEAVGMSGQPLDLGGGQPPLCASPVALTWISTVAPGRRRAISSSTEVRSTDSQTSTRRSRWPHLVRLQPADEVDGRSRRGGIEVDELGEQLLERSSRRSSCTPPPPRATMASGPKPLVTATISTVRPTATAAMRSRSAESRSATSRASTEGGRWSAISARTTGRRSRRRRRPTGPPSRRTAR